MPKKISDNQDAGTAGEDQFRHWASSVMHWYCTKPNPDSGIDFVCQIRGKRISPTSSLMPDHWLHVSVRSTTKNSDFVRIDKSDAQLLLSPSNINVLALVRRAPYGQSGEIGIRVPDAEYVQELDAFIRGKAKSRRIFFSSALTDRDAIRTAISHLLLQPYSVLMMCWRVQSRLGQYKIPDPKVEFKHSPDGNTIKVPVPAGVQIDTMATSMNGLFSGMGGNFKVTFDPVEHNVDESWNSTGVVAQDEDHPGSDVAEVIANEASQSQELITLPARINNELLAQNHERALSLANELDATLYELDANECPVLGQLLYIVARVHAIYEESREDTDKPNTEKLSDLLGRIEKLPFHANDKDLMDRVEALYCAKENLEKGVDAALERLGESDTPYAIRMRLWFLLKKQNPAGALALIEARSPHTWWCDVATRVFVLNGRINDARAMVEWAKDADGGSRYPQCLVSFADTLLIKSFDGLPEGHVVMPSDLDEKAMAKLRDALEALQPILTPLLASESAPSGLETSALKIACKANQLLGHQERLTALAKMLLKARPVPLEVAQSAVAGQVPTPPDLPQRLRKEHPDDLNAGVLACLLEDTRLQRHESAFEHAKKLLPLTENQEQRDELFKAFHQVWQELDGEALEECQQIARSLVKDNPKLRAMFEAAVALREGDADSALKFLAEARDEKDLVWVQLQVGALESKGDLPNALDVLANAARQTNAAYLLQRAGDLAMHLERFEVAAELFEKLSEQQLENLQAHYGLASVYSVHGDEYDKAIPHYRALLAAEPENESFILNLSTCFARLYRWEESVEVLNKACQDKQPPVKILIARSEIYRSRGKLSNAFNSLHEVRDTYWDDPRFLAAYMHAGHAAGKDELADEAFAELIRKHKAGDVPEPLLKSMDSDEAKSMILEGAQEQQKRNELLHNEMLHGRMPWTWEAQISGEPIYMAWRKRTQQMRWIGETPVNRASFSVYATNGFHSQTDESGKKDLRPLECSAKGKKIAIDISALITLHRLGLLDNAADYFGEILVPKGYLSAVLTEGGNMVPQRSLGETAGRIVSAVTEGRIKVVQNDCANRPLVDEHTDSEDHCYKLCDLVSPMHENGVIGATNFNRISKVCAKETAVDKEQPVLNHLQEIAVAASTLETIARFDLLDAAASFYELRITEDELARVKQHQNAVEFQDEVRTWHYDLWDLLREDGRFTFVPHEVPEEFEEKGRDEDNTSPFLGCFVAEENNVPLLADDRVLHVLVSGKKSEGSTAVFGSDALVTRLVEDEVLTEAQGAQALLKLMEWRYRFVRPSVRMLMSFAHEYSSHPPGKPLHQIAEYMHDCMRDPGLFGGPENTQLGESMAQRLYVSWLKLAGSFILEIWLDEKFSDEKAQRLTQWCVREMLPSLPRSIVGDGRIRVSSMTPRVLISHVLLEGNTRDQEGDNTSKALSVMQEALQLEKEDYLKIVTETLNDFQRIT